MMVKIFFSSSNSVKNTIFPPLLDIGTGMLDRKHLIEIVLIINEYIVACLV